MSGRVVKARKTIRRDRDSLLMVISGRHRNLKRCPVRKSREARLCRLMCGKASPYRGKFFDSFEATPRFAEAEPQRDILHCSVPERQSLSAHRAAKPLYSKL